MSKGGPERRTHTHNPEQAPAVSCHYREPDAGLELMNREIMT